MIRLCIAFVRHDRALSDHLVVVRGVLGLLVIVVSESGVITLIFGE
jgi:hypothetical protein